MLRMAGDPMIETAIAKGNTLNDFNFIINSFNRTIGIRSCYGSLSNSVAD